MLFLREFCDTSSVLKVIMFAKELIKIIFVLVPIGLIIMTSIDIAKNIISGKEDDMKKNVNIAIKRVIMAVIVFFIPTIVSVVNGLVEESTNGSFLYNECLDNANSDFIKDMENEEITEKELEKLNRQENQTSDIIKTNTTTGTASGQSLPEDDKYYPLDSKDENGNDLKYLEVDSNFLTDSEMSELDKFIWNSVNKSEDWGTRVATAGWALAYGLSQKGLKLHYQKGGWATDDRTNGTIGKTRNCEINGYCANWGRLLTNSGIDYTCNQKSWGGYVNTQSPKKDCSNGLRYNKKYAGLDCTGFVKWAIRTGCGVTINDSHYQNNLPKTSNIDEAEPGDVLLTSGHVRLFLKKNNDGTYMIAESSSGQFKNNGLFFHKYTKSQLSSYKVIKMSSEYSKVCKKTS